MSVLSELTGILGGTNAHILLAALEQLGEGVIVADTEGKLIYVNSAAEALHGVKELDVEPDRYSETYHLLTPEGEPHPFEDLPLARAVMKGETVENAHWKIRRPDGTEVDAVGTARPVLDENGKQVASVLTIFDRTEDLRRQRELDTALAAKETLLYEVNHRVKNNLAIVSSMMRIQARAVEDKAAKRLFEEASSRVHTLAELHRKLYQTGQHNKIEIVSYLCENVEETVEALSSGKTVSVRTKTNGVADMTLDRAVPFVLAVNELTVNSMKHAFADTPDPRIELEIDVTETAVDVVYRDNGCGISEACYQQAMKSRGLGRALILNLSSQLSATVDVLTDQKGYCANISVPIEAVR
ncbi:histidine kinase dimerization/phosphoacceptor domain -containing protein [Parvularcula lutaonensis]|uniref:histidine kinase n=1 Tax=Parvularcula lutaonensis TaxID=491923 RepID=A0ABV7M9T2_9PROT|nr:histidine kinase dimerization/phosphoacceptor domain -containing protein [Parvularcula lutaonensis]GGY43231.1 hypothetical protein GCM10007148_09930 [Parvularcula lutaonensis]